MRFSQLFGKTLREAPAGVVRPGEQLALRAALLRPGSRWVNWLPLGHAFLLRLHARAARSLAALGGQEAYVVVTPETVHHYQGDIVSYRDLPRLTYRLHVGHSISAASFNRNQAEAGAAFQATTQAFVDLAQAAGIRPSAVEAGPGETHFVAVHPQGDQELLICTSPECGYAALSAWAGFQAPAGLVSEPAPLQKVATPHCATIAELADFLKIETRQTLKAVLYTADNAELVFIVIRGDLEISEAKLLHTLKARTLRQATATEIAAAGAVPGYASPAGLKVAAGAKERGRGKITVVADSSIESGSNFAAGANEAGYHFVQVNFPRDFQVTLLADIAQARPGSPCPRCGAALQFERAFELGGCHDAGPTRLNYLSEAGRPEAVWLGVYWLRPEAVLLACLDQNHDAAGIVWPDALAPADVHLVRLGKAPATQAAADTVYEELRAAGKNVLYDDRDESPGVKFADADLIGLPVRLTVSDKSLIAGGVEVKRRVGADKVIMNLGDVLNTV
jgi:prolyl-tRNA synthetase